MAYNPFIGRSLEWLEAQLEAAQTDLGAGSVVNYAEAGDAKTQTKIDKSPDERIKLILKALNKIDPDTYPIADITAIDRTRVTFWNQPSPTVSQ